MMGWSLRNWNFSEQEKKELIAYMFDIGFIYDATPLLDLKTDLEREKRIQEYMNQGYRISLMFDQPVVINVKGNPVSDELNNELVEAYKWLTTKEGDL